MWTWRWVIRSSGPDAPAALVLVEPKRQREALSYLTSTIYAEDFFDWSPRLLNELASPRWWDWASYAPLRIDYPAHQVALRMQS